MLVRLISVSVLCAAPLSVWAGEGLKLEFIDHISAEMIEQDVYIDKMSDGKVFRVTKDDYSEYSDETVYRTAAPVEHAPMDPEKVGPYDAGAPLDFTLGDWLSASGEASLTCDGEKGQLNASFSGLVPGGLYTMWNFFAGQNLEKFHTYDLPLGAPDGSQSAFRADDKGNAIYEATFEPCLQGTSPQLMAGLAIAYHSDDMTHGYEPGPMGNKSHVQLFTMLPPQQEMP